MFACIYGLSVKKNQIAAPAETVKPASVLVNLAFEFSPLVEQTATDTVVLDMGGQGILFGDANIDGGSRGDIDAGRNLAEGIVRRVNALKLKIGLAVAGNPDAAIHAARSFKGVNVIPNGEELSKLRDLSIKTIDCSLVGIDAKRAAEIQETFALWGVRTFGDLARLPLAGVAERLGQEGVWLQKLAQGKTDRSLNLVRPPIGFEQSLELEHPVCEFEPLTFILSRLLNQICANLIEYALATNELRLELRLESGTRHQRTITLPAPMRNPKTLLRLLHFDIEAHPPPAPIISVAIIAEPVKPRASQTGLFIPLAPEPEKLEITLARLAKLVGAENVGSPEILDTHRPDAFQVNRFSLPVARNGRSNPQFAIRNSHSVMGFRMFRPAWRAEVQTQKGTPTRISARSEQSGGTLRGTVVRAAGPWRASGDWWCHDVWARDEWDMAVIEAASPESEVLCRVFRDLVSEQWFVAGMYD